jgi:hypothetical protein
LSKKTIEAEHTIEWIHFFNHFYKTLWDGRWNHKEVHKTYADIDGKHLEVRNIWNIWEQSILLIGDGLYIYSEKLVWWKEVSQIVNTWIKGEVTLKQEW